MVPGVFALLIVLAPLTVVGLVVRAVLQYLRRSVHAKERIAAALEQANLERSRSIPPR